MKENNISISEDVVVTIAGIAAKEIEGVAGLHIGVVDTILDKVKGANFRSGVSVAHIDDKIGISVIIDTIYGYKIQDVAKNVQENIKNALENMTDKQIAEVNVHVHSVVIAE